MKKVTKIKKQRLELSPLDKKYNSFNTWSNKWLKELENNWK